MDLEVKHDERAGKYYAVVDGLESVCEYGPAGDRVLNFFHTYVPSGAARPGDRRRARPPGAGRRPGARLKVVPSCWFVRVYIDRHAKVSGGAGLTGAAPPAPRAPGRPRGPGYGYNVRKL